MKEMFPEIKRESSLQITREKLLLLVQFFFHIKFSKNEKKVKLDSNESKQ